MTIGRDIIGNLAKQFGYSKELVRQALSSNQIDPLTASLIGSRIDKMQQTKQEAGARTTVLEDVLSPKPEEVMGQGIAGVPQEAPAALAALPSNLPTEGMAGGGIVAFADGGETRSAMNIAPPTGYTLDTATGKFNAIEQPGSGLLAMLRGEGSPIIQALKKARGYAEGGVTLPDDDDEDEPREKSTMSQLMGGLSSGLASLKSVIPQGRGISIPQSYEAALAEKGQTPASARKLMMEGPKKGDYVMPPLDSQKPGAKSGGHKYEEAVIREAERIGLDPSLARHVLYKETGNLRNPETARSKAGALGVMQLMPKTAKELGVDPLDPEQNIRGGVMYLKKMMDKYNDPTLALAAYNAGPGRVDRAIKSGRGIESLPRETRNYVVANRMAGGGIVAFQNTGLVSGEFGGETSSGEEGFVSVDPYFVTDPMTGRPVPSGYRRSVPKSEARPEAIIQKPTSIPAQTVPTKKTFSDEDEGPYTGQAPAPEIDIKKLIGGEQGGEKEDSIMKKYLSLLEGREKASTDQRKTDAYLSLLSAGLGIMGGTSPFAGVNIGQGAQAGVATQMGARKSQIAEEAATLKGFGTAAAAEEYAKQRQLLAAQGQEAKIGNLIATREKQLENAAFNAVTKTGLMIDSAEGQAAIAREVQRLKAADPLLTKLYKQYGLPPIEVGQPPNLVKSAEERLKQRGLK